MSVEAAGKPKQAPSIFFVYRHDGEDHVFCPVRNKPLKVSGKPEEIVRQWWLYRLVGTYGYSFDQIGVEVPVTVGSTEAKKKADIVVYTNNTKSVPLKPMPGSSM
jgi:type I restriction enzyme M protein